MNTTNGDSAKSIFDIDDVNAIVPMRMLSATWNGGSKRPPYILGRLDHISTSRFRDEHNHTGTFAWSDPRTGKTGEGSVSLVAHILKIDPDEAARRIMAFLVPGNVDEQKSHLAYRVGCTRKAARHG